MITSLGVIALIAVVLGPTPGAPSPISGRILATLSGEAFPRSSGQVPPFQSNSPPVQNNQIYPGNNYHYSYDAGDGIKVEETGQFHQIERSDNPRKEVNGSYRWISPEGEVISVTYVADENGFRPVVQRSFNSVRNRSK